MFQRKSTVLLLGACALALGCAAKSQSEPVMRPASGTTVVRVSRSEATLSEAKASETEQPAGANASETRSSNLPQSYSTSAPVMSPKAALAAITKARCERELECRNVGLGRKFNAIENCEDELGAATRHEVGAAKCSRGHDPGKLEQCLREIGSADCRVSLDSLGALLACPRSALCR